MDFSRPLIRARLIRRYKRFLSDLKLGDGTLVEVKSVTLMRDGWAEFPDSVTARGAKHLTELTEAARGGRPAAMLCLLARDDVARIRIASDIDPAYAAAFDAARTAGVRLLGLATQITPQGVRAAGAVPVDPAPQSGQIRDSRLYTARKKGFASVRQEQPCHPRRDSPA